MADSVEAYGEPEDPFKLEHEAVPYTKKGYCVYHIDVQLRKKKKMFGWKVIHDKCPRCKDEEWSNVHGDGALLPEQPLMAGEKKKVDETPIKTAVDALRTKKKQKISTAQALYSLEGLVELTNGHNKVNRVKVQEEGGIPVILKAMKQLPKEAAVQEQGCQLLHQLAYVQKNELEIVAEGAPEIICAAMKKHDKDEGVQKQGVCAIRVLACQVSNKAPVAEAGAIDVVCKAMSKYPDNSQIRRMGTRALFNLGNSKQGALMVHAAGGLKVVLKTMRKHMDDAVTQEASFKVLQNLANTPECSDDVFEEGSTDAILSSMNHLPDNADIQSNGFRALGNIAFDVDYTPHIAELEGIEQTIATLQRHISRVEVQAAGIRLLGNLASKRDHLKERIVVSGGTETVMESMKQHGFDGNVQGEGCFTLWNLSSFLPYVDKMVEDGGIQLVLDSLLNHPNHRQVKHFGPRLQARMQGPQA